MVWSPILLLLYSDKKRVPKLFSLLPPLLKKLVSLSHVRAVQVTGTKHVGVMNRVIKQHLLSTPSSGLIHL